MLCPNRPRVGTHYKDRKRADQKQVGEKRAVKGNSVRQSSDMLVACLYYSPVASARCCSRSPGSGIARYCPFSGVFSFSNQAEAAPPKCPMA